MKKQYIANVNENVDNTHIPFGTAHGPTETTYTHVYPCESLQNN